MVGTTYAVLKEKNDALVFTAADWIVLLHKWTSGASYMPTALTDSAGVLQTLPAGWRTSGEIAQKSALEITADSKSTPIMGYGSSVPRRELLTEESYAIDYSAQEWRKINLEMMFNTDLTAVTAAPGIGWKARKTASLDIQYYSALLIAKDGQFEAELYPFFMFSKVSVSKRGKLAGKIGEELPLPFTLSALSDDEWGGVFDFGVAGAGMDDIAEAAGFVAEGS
jgi:hypothetical protein